jgi:hypothetical protein
VQQQAAGAGPEQAGLLALIAEPVGGLGGEVEGAAGVAGPLGELDGRLPAADDRGELVEQQGGVLTAAGLAEGGVVGEVLQHQPHAGVGVLPPRRVGGAEVGEGDLLERPPCSPASKPPAVAAKKVGVELGVCGAPGRTRTCNLPFRRSERPVRQGLSNAVLAG